MAERAALLLEENLAMGGITGGIGGPESRSEKDAASEKPGGKSKKGGTHRRRQDWEGKKGRKEQQ